MRRGNRFIVHGSDHTPVVQKVKVEVTELSIKSDTAI